MHEFHPFPKLPRLYRDCVITEKIDGTNAQVFITDEGEVIAGSRTRWITPEDDNHGFARWVKENDKALFELLGYGHHFGEWWGGSIQKRYSGIVKEKRFSLFNSARWANIENDSNGLLYVVPVLYSGPFESRHVDGCIEELKKYGSTAARGCMNPEGVVTYHTASGISFKTTCSDDESPKSKPAIGLRAIDKTTCNNNESPKGQA